MNKKIYALATLSVLIAACGHKDERKTEKTTAPVAAEGCRSPALPAHLRDQLQDSINEEARRLIGADVHLIDADKIAAAASQLKVTLNSIQDKNGQCRGKLSIVIPQNITQSAQENAPLLNINHYDTIIEDSMGGVNFQFNGSTLSLPLNYTVKNNGNRLEVNYEDDGFKTSASALTAALLPYGVKENIVLNGKTLSRDMALQIVQRGGSLSAPPPAPEQPQQSQQSQQQSVVATAPAHSAATPTPNARTTTPPHTATASPNTSMSESPEQKALREAKAAEAKMARLAAQAAERAAKAKAAREAAEAAKLKAAEAKNTENKASENKTAEAKTDGKTTETTPSGKTAENKPANKAIDFTAKTAAASAANSGNNTTPSANNNAGSTTNAEVEAPKIAKPPKKARVSDDEMDKVRKAHKQADQEIKSSWKKISPDIQKDLVEEQKTWEKQRNQRCRQAAAAGSDESESSKLYMQCDTRMTKERVKSLEGYSIQ